jgi:hypothetical protein
MRQAADGYAPVMPTDKRKVAACKRRFKTFYPGGFQDEDYIALERQYKWDAHRAWTELVAEKPLAARLRDGDYEEFARAVVRIESRTNLLFSFEKMAVRDAVSTPDGAKAFVAGLADWFDGPGGDAARFERWCDAVDTLPRRQTRVRTWPVVTVFGFIARPRTHIFLKPTVTKRAAEAFGFEFDYRSRPQWETYASFLSFARAVRAEVADWEPRDMIDIQSFIWVLGSAEYD